MFVQPQRRTHSRAVINPSCKQGYAARPNAAPAYYLGWPASLWIGVTGARREQGAPGQLPDAIAN